MLKFGGVSNQIGFSKPEPTDESVKKSNYYSGRY